jgi:GTP pyrophosphokinase
VKVRLGRRFQEALTYAAELHAHQVRKGTGTPYLAHLLAVTSLALEAGADEDEAIAALLHDAPEDQGGLETLNEIRRRFGERVAAVVAECSDTLEPVKPPWAARKRAYLAGLETASKSALLVSCADKLHNARATLADYRELGEALWPRFRGGREGTLWYYRALVDRYRAAGAPARLLDELERAVVELESVSGEPIQPLEERPPESSPGSRDPGHADP